MGDQVREKHREQDSASNTFIKLKSIQVQHYNLNIRLGSQDPLGKEN